MGRVAASLGVLRLNKYALGGEAGWVALVRSLAFEDLLTKTTLVDSPTA